MRIVWGALASVVVVTALAVLGWTELAPKAWTMARIEAVSAAHTKVSADHETRLRAVEGSLGKIDAKLDTAIRLLKEKR